MLTLGLLRVMSCRPRCPWTILVIGQVSPVICQKPASGGQNSAMTVCVVHNHTPIIPELVCAIFLETDSVYFKTPACKTPGGVQRNDAARTYRECSQSVGCCRIGIFYQDPVLLKGDDQRQFPPVLMVSAKMRNHSGSRPAGAVVKQSDHRRRREWPADIPGG